MLAQRARYGRITHGYVALACSVCNAQSFAQWLADLAEAIEGGDLQEK